MKKFLSIVLSCFIVFSNVMAINSEDNYIADKKANALNALNIIKGDENGFGLSNYPTRIEAVIILLRLTGNEKEALTKNLKHPFSDVENWASPYAGYAYAMGLTSGVSENFFGTEEPLTAQQFTTFILRVLGYNDIQGDFNVEDAVKFAHDKNIITSKINIYDFKRCDMITILYDVLGSSLKDSDMKLSEKLKMLNVFNSEDEKRATKIIADSIK